MSNKECPLFIQGWIASGRTILDSYMTETTECIKEKCQLWDSIRINCGLKIKL